MLTKEECLQYQNFVSRYQRYLYALLGSYLARTHLRSNMKVLDLGTGPGNLSREILERSEATVVGVDINIAMLELAQATLADIDNARWELRLADVHRLPFITQEFDIVISYSCFHHWSDPVQGLQECRRVLAPGGRLLLFDTIRSPYRSTLALLQEMITEPELFRFVEEAFAESFTIQEVCGLASSAALHHASVKPFTFAEEDIINCLDQLPDDLPISTDENPPATLWLLEAVNHSRVLREAV